MKRRDILKIISSIPLVGFIELSNAKSLIDNGVLILAFDNRIPFPSHGWKTIPDKIFKGVDLESFVFDRNYSYNVLKDNELIGKF